MRGATLGEERCDLENFSATRRVVTSDLQWIDGKNRQNNLCGYLPVVSSDDNSTGTCLLPILDLVDFIEAFSFIG
jgi:hypothetical protein